MVWEREKKVVFTDAEVETLVFELTILLAQGTLLTAAMNYAIPTRALLQRVLPPYFGAIAA